MKFPKRDAVGFVVRSVLKRRKADSQEEFRDLVAGKLKEVDSEYSISGERLRRIAVSMPGVEVRMWVKRGRAPKRCPCCGSGLRRTWTRNLKGRKILERLGCSRCGYRGHDGKWLPCRYRFSLKTKS